MKRKSQTTQRREIIMEKATGKFTFAGGRSERRGQGTLVANRSKTVL